MMELWLVEESEQLREQYARAKADCTQAKAESAQTKASKERFRKKLHAAKGSLGTHSFASIISLWIRWMILLN